MVYHTASYIREKIKNLPKIVPVRNGKHYWQLIFEDGGALTADDLEMEKALSLSFTGGIGSGSGGGITAQRDMVHGVERVKEYQLPEGVTLTIAMGSVAYFSGDAIVNAANESCQGGGGVDGAVTMWGGEALKKARSKLKNIGRSRTKRCNTGSAVTTTAGDLPCSHVVHGVGPNYKDYRNSDDADKLLASAYESSVREASRVGARSLACSLLSAGIYRAGQSLGHVLQVGLKSVQKASRELKDKSPKELFFVAFTQEEKDALIKQADTVFSGAGSANASGASKRRRLPPRGTRQNKPISPITSNDDNDDDDDDDDDGSGGGKGRKKSGGGGRRGGEKGGKKSGSGPDVRQQNRYGYKYEFDNLGRPGDYEMESNSDDEGSVHAQPGSITHHHKMIKDKLEEGQRKEVEEVWDSVDGCIHPTDKEKLYDREVALRVVFNRPAGAAQSKVGLLGKHVCRLIPGGWLHDEVINMYMWLLQCRSNKYSIMANSRAAKPSHYFNSFFMEKLIELEGQSLREHVKELKMDRFADKVTAVKGNVFLLDKIVVRNHTNDQCTPFLPHQLA